MSAVRDLSRQSITLVAKFLKRYWLLVTWPELYFDTFIKAKKSRDLKETIGHTIIAAAGMTLYFGATQIFKPLSSIVPSYAALILTSKLPFLFAIIFATAPAFLFFLLVFRLMGENVSDLVFIYFNVLTMYLLTILAFIAFSILFALVYFPLQSFLQPKQIGTAEYVVLVVIASPVVVAMYAWLSSWFYVPLILFEKSTQRSTLFASALCIAGLMVCMLAFVAVARPLGLFNSLDVEELTTTETR